MKCCPVEEREKRLGVSAFQKKLYPNGAKVCSDEVFLPSCQALSDNTNTLVSVLSYSG